MCVRCFIHILFVKNKKEEDKVLTYHTLVGQDCFVSRQVGRRLARFLLSQ